MSQSDREELDVLNFALVDAKIFEDEKEDEKACYMGRRSYLVDGSIDQQLRPCI